MIIILGAGPAGLGVARGLRRTHGGATILEAGSAAGGLCQSFEVGSCTFDYGGHAFFTKSDRVKEVLDIESKCHTQDRSAWVWTSGTLTPYPFQANLKGLPDDVVRDCVLGVVDAALTVHTAAPPTNLRDWIVSTFGDGIGRHFMLPYNTKLWAHPIEDIAVGWTSDRVVQPDVRSVIEGAILERAYAEFPNATVAYPKTGGFIELYRPLAESQVDLRLGDPAVSLDLEAKTVRTSSATFPYETLVSSIPLNRLVEIARKIPADVREAAEGLRWNSLLLVSMAVETEGDPTEAHRIYSADPDVPFHKLVLNSNSSPALRRRKHFGIQAEISFSRTKAKPVGDLPALVAESAREIGILRANDAVIHSDIRTLEQAYPIQTLDTAQRLDTIIPFFEDRQVYPVGRFGRWQYLNSDAALLAGIELGEALSRGAVK